MANITTNTLKIGDNSLVLRDADAQTKLATHTQKIAALEEDTSSLKEDMTSIPNSSLGLVESYNYPLALEETLTDKYPSGSIGSAISFYNSANSITKKFKIPDGITSVYSRISLNSFTRITTASGIILATGAASIESIPDGAKYLYISMNKNTIPAILEDNLVWISSEGLFNYATEHSLYSPEYKSFYRDIIQPLWYDNIVDDSIPFVTEKDFSKLTINLNNNTNNRSFFSNGGNGKITIELTNTVTSGVTTVRLMYYAGSWKTISETNKELTAGDQTIEWTGIDFASLIQYQAATNFGIMFANSGVSKVEISTITGKNLSNLSTYDLYSDHFSTMMQNVMSAISGGGSTSEQLNLRNPNGEKFGLMITPSNTLGTFKYTPDNMLIMGNSLVFGFSNGDESFGMAATSGENDFSYHLIESIKEYNPNVNVTKLYSSPFEHADTLESAQTFLTDNTAYWNESLDLVVIEMGDNVNTEAKRTVFAQSFPLLLTKIRTQCPKARVICTGIWFNNSTVHNIMTTNANKYGCEFVDITPIRNSETEGELGATVYFKDGTTTTVTEGRVTHPGNLGMERIAEAIFNKLDIQ